MTYNKLKIMKKRMIEKLDKQGLFAFVLIFSFLFLGAVTLAQEHEIEVTGEELLIKEDYSPYSGISYPDKVLFGEMHLHTKYSADAGLIGTTLDIDDAYKFARGDMILSNTGQRVQLVRPLDFTIVSDHAEYIGLAPMIRNSDPVLLADPFGKMLHDKFRSGPEGAAEAFGALIEEAAVGETQFSPAATESIWKNFVKIADTYDQPGVFTALTGFEWSSVPNGNNLHRVIMFADGADKTSQVIPFSLYDSEDPEDLWDYLENYEKKTGGNVLALAHNGNLSNGIMFTDVDFNGKPLTKAYAERRMRWEPVYEVTQMKGDGETHPYLSPTDEFADYGTWDVSNLAGSAPKTKDMLAGEYARSAYKLGIELDKKIGANPFKFGMAAATDSHTGLATSREENYFGKYAKTEPKPDRHNYEVIPAEDKSLRIVTSQELASGLTACWARDNTRTDIYESMMRKETYATTGTRIRVRLFAGWDFKADEVVRPDFAKQGYLRGVPMGGDLSNAPSGQAPKFMIRALRDPDGANLDRIQVIKGWLDSNGEAQERIYDVAVTDDRKIGKDGRCKTPVQSTVDLENATYTNTVGEAVLTAYWEDPEFDANQHAFYYVRVLEIPTPRWTTYDAAYYGVKRPDNVPATTQDRAYTSPVWYTPGN
jgi:hypothetical protein